MLASSTRTATKKAAVAPQLRGADRSAAARRRSVLEQSFGHLPEPEGPFAGRREEMTQIAQWVHAARASTETKPTVVVLYGDAGSGRTTLAVRASHHLKDQFRGACVVDLRGDSADPLSTRDALLHLLNRLGAPREQLLFRERSSAEQQVRRLSELYHQHLTGLPVTVVLDDASDAAQVRTLVPERSDSLVLVTARRPLDLADDIPAWVHQLPVDALDPAGAEELLRASAEEPSSGPYDAQSADAVRELCGGLPLALRVAGSSLGPRTAHQLAADLGAYGPVDPVERALWLRYTDQPEQARRLLRRARARRTGLAGRGSGGGAAGHGRAGGSADALGPGEDGPDRPCASQPLPAARCRTVLRPGPASGRGGGQGAGGRAGAADPELRGPGRGRDPHGGRQDVHAGGPVRGARLLLAGRGAALAGRRVELHHLGAAARGV